MLIAGEEGLWCNKGMVVVEERIAEPLPHAFPNRFTQSALMHQIAQVYTRPANISRCNSSLVSDHSVAQD